MIQIDRRSTLLLPAAVGLASIPVQAIPQSGQSDALNLDQLIALMGFLGQQFDGFQLTRKDEFAPMFLASLRLRAALAEGPLSAEAEAASREITFDAEQEMADIENDLSFELAAQIAENTQKFQNTVVAVATQDNGEVRIEGGILFRVREILCPLYPFC